MCFISALVSWIISKTSIECNTRYHHNYYVHTNATTRTYYASPQALLQLSQHFFIDTGLCELFSTMMETSWTSATNCARIYNQGLGTDVIRAQLPADWPTSLELDVEDVWNAFFLHALLQDCQERGIPLELKHNASSHAERLKPALHARNLRMAGTGQEAWNHACDACCYVYTAEDGSLRESLFLAQS